MIRYTLISCVLITHFLVQGIAIALANSQSDTRDIFYGEMDAGPRVFRFVVETQLSAATLTSLDEGNAKFKLEEFLYDDSKLSFLLKSTGAKFEGARDQASQEVRGTWKQGGANLPLVFKRVDAVPIDVPDEIWKGTLKAGLQNLEMQVRAYSIDSEKPTFFVDSLSQKVGGFKADLVFEDSKVVLSVPALRAKYEGTRNDSKDEIVGKWSQGVPLELVLKKMKNVTTSADVAPKRPQHPLAPFPYTVQELTFTNDSEGIELAGTLTIPTQGDSLPLAILISGSGPQDRDETIMDHKPFWVLADHLTRRGIAVLRYDERGVGASKGKFQTATTSDFANDVRSAVKYAKTIDRINPKNIGLVGHSEGGLIAPMVAIQDKDVAWVVLMASPGVNGEEIMYSQGQLIVAAEGGSEQEKKRQLSIQKRCFEAMKNSANEKEFTKNIDRIVQAVVEEVAPINADASADESKKDQRKLVGELVKANLNAMNSPWFRFFAAHEPGPVLEKVSCPVLAINGTKDVQVDPKLNLPKIEASLRRGGNARFITKELPGLNHLFQTCRTGGMSEYQTIEETIAPLALNAITEWILSLHVAN